MRDDLHGCVTLSSCSKSLFVPPHQQNEIFVICLRHVQKGKELKDRIIELYIHYMRCLGKDQNSREANELLEIIEKIDRANQALEIRSEVFHQLSGRQVYEADLVQSFEDALRDKVEQMASTTVFDSKETRSELDRQLDLALMADDEIVIEGSSTASVARNDRCPVTKIRVMDLVDPVEDSKGYVYEKQAIMHLLQRSRNQSIECPEAGTQHLVRIQDLHPARKVLAAREREHQG